MNDLMSLYKHIVYMDGGLKYCDLTSIIHQINTTPQKNIGWGYSIDLAKELMQCNQTGEGRIGRRTEICFLTQ